MDMNQQVMAGRSRPLVQPKKTARPDPVRTERVRRPVPAPTITAASRSSVDAAKATIQPKLMQQIDKNAAVQMPQEELAKELAELMRACLEEENIQLNQLEQRELVEALLHDMLGLGPLEPLLADESINDIMVNGPKQVYVERAGKLELTDVEFRDNAHVMNIARRWRRCCASPGGSAAPS